VWTVCSAVSFEHLCRVLCGHLCVRAVWTAFVPCVVWTPFVPCAMLTSVPRAIGYHLCHVPRGHHLCHVDIICATCHADTLYAAVPCGHHFYRCVLWTSFVPCVCYLCCCALWTSFVPCDVWVYPSVLCCVRQGCRFYPETVAVDGSVRPGADVPADRHVERNTIEERSIFPPVRIN